MVGLDQRDELRPIGCEQSDDEGGTFREPRIRLDARVAELEVRRCHVGEAPLGEPEPPARCDLDGARSHPDESCFDGLHGVNRSEQLRHVVFGQVERQKISVPSPTFVRIMNRMAVSATNAKSDGSLLFDEADRAARFEHGALDLGANRLPPRFPATLAPLQSARSSGDRALPCGGRGRKFESCRAHSRAKTGPLRGP